MLKNRPYSVPDGYFDDLQSKLSEIPHMPGRKASGWQMVQPYLALVICFCSILVLGKLIMNKAGSLPEASDSIYEQLIYADMIPHAEPDAIFYTEQSAAGSDYIAEDDVIAYLIETGTSIELIDYLSK